MLGSICRRRFQSERVKRQQVLQTSEPLVGLPGQGIYGSSGPLPCQGTRSGVRTGITGPPPAKTIHRCLPVSIFGRGGCHALGNSSEDA
jgi:hypothetical protein